MKEGEGCRVSEGPTWADSYAAAEDTRGLGGLVVNRCIICSGVSVAVPQEGRFVEINPMGRVLTDVTIENTEDLWSVKRGLLPADQVRRIDVSDALVDTGATLLSLPTRLIQQLGLGRVSSKRVTSNIGISEAGVYDAVRLTIMGRSCTMDVMEVPDTVPVLIGQIPLEHLDFVVDLRNRKLIGNPAHGGEHVYERY